MSVIKRPLTTHELFDEFLRSNRKRRTVERFAILERVGNTTGHFSAESLFEIMQNDGYHVSPTTVYSTLELLVECGLVKRHRFNNKASIYERASGSASNHHHLICSMCGKIKEMRDSDIDTIIKNKRFPAFTQTSFALNIYGICSTCTRKQRREKKLKK